MIAGMTTPILSASDLGTYQRDGYVLVRSLVPRPDAEAVVAASPRPSSGSDWTPVIFDHARPQADPAQHALLAHPRVLDAVELLLGGPARAYYGMLAVVPAGGGRGLPWHQDNQYEHIVGHALNAFIALCRITPKMCNLWVAPGSHRDGLRPSGAAEGRGGHREDSGAVQGICLPTLEPGDACIFNRYTLHRSLHNQTNEDRFAYAAQYEEADARRDDGRASDRILARDLQRLLAPWHV